MRKAQLWTKQSSPRPAPSSLSWSPPRSPTCSTTKSSRRAVPRSLQLQHSASFPVYTSSSSPSSPRKTDWGQWAPLVSAHHRRPLPALPQQQPCRPRLSLQTDLVKQRETGGKREVQRRQTFHCCPSSSSYHSHRDDREDHIYEEIEDEDDSEDDGDDHSFLSLISSERRRNLRLYGLTDWDYGNQRS